MKRLVPHSKEKAKRRANALHWKMRLQKAKGKVIDRELMEKRKDKAQAKDECEEMQEIQNYLKIVQENGKT